MGIETVVPAAGMLAKQNEFEKDDATVDNFTLTETRQVSFSIRIKCGRQRDHITTIDYFKFRDVEDIGLNITRFPHLINGSHNNVVL